ncbi:hypothetical protein CH253_18155 [Rhodococcus sp. 06-156-3C]|nr:hypothetical protein CH248_27355 [Rhodococcus sp. 06-156-4a]OZD18107.1 hypothetical protein CH253_18155 [Rhodococcus sp. 06-156-3C]OZD20718.1 hypothetical protein CH280_03310 [Rhodococcus sp. 06-156-4C]OZD30741.1 hypothetical protein CH247_15420 [Rhodococcus sp. 06-156-3b]OZD32665.1 hypothetical protein CH284_19840 [Rhodococcus sp. 06-156-3]OZF65103.1 hypothetical protein CH290_10745 [Rhodococcus sp. 06-156-4]
MKVHRTFSTAAGTEDRIDRRAAETATGELLCRGVDDHITGNSRALLLRNAGFVMRWCHRDHTFPTSQSIGYSLPSRPKALMYRRPHSESKKRVHVEVPDRGTAIAVGNQLRPWLPILLALTANSAFYDGADTGYASWRSVLWSRWPSTGPPPILASQAHYDEMVAQMRGVEAILDDGMVQ